MYKGSKKCRPPNEGVFRLSVFPRWRVIVGVAISDRPALLKRTLVAVAASGSCPPSLMQLVSSRW